MNLLALILLAGSLRLPPRDDGAKDPSFVAFRHDLLEIVRRHDTEALLSNLDTRVRTDFGGGGGKEDFKRTWKLPGEGSRVWGELSRLLALGSTRRGKTIWAPYVYGSWPENVDAFRNVAALAPDVPVFDHPNGKAVDRLDYEIVPVLAGIESRNPNWKRIRTGRGRVGFVRSSSVRSPVDYRASFEKSNGRWRITALVAGD